MREECSGAITFVISFGKGSWKREVGRL